MVEYYARIYNYENVSILGIPLSIIYDRGIQLTIHFWRYFKKGLGTRVKLITVFHPKIDGPTENTIQTLMDMLRACLIDFKGN